MQEELIMQNYVLRICDCCILRQDTLLLRPRCWLFGIYLVSSGSGLKISILALRSCMCLQTGAKRSDTKCEIYESR